MKVKHKVITKFRFTDEELETLRWALTLASDLERNETNFGPRATALLDAMLNEMQTRPVAVPF